MYGTGGSRESPGLLQRTMVRTGDLPTLDSWDPGWYESLTFEKPVRVVSLREGCPLVKTSRGPIETESVPGMIPNSLPHQGHVVGPNKTVTPVEEKEWEEETETELDSLGFRHLPQCLLVEWSDRRDMLQYLDC